MVDGLVLDGFTVPLELAEALDIAYGQLTEEGKRNFHAIL